MPPHQIEVLIVVHCDLNSHHSIHYQWVWMPLKVLVVLKLSSQRATKRRHLGRSCQVCTSLKCLIAKLLIHFELKA